MSRIFCPPASVLKLATCVLRLVTCILKLIRTGRLGNTFSDLAGVLKSSCSKVLGRVKRVLDDDMGYKRHFLSSSGQRIYHMHTDSDCICCAFCAHLRRSHCHELCFSCSKGIYTECSPLLPGIFPFSGSRPDEQDRGAVPWIMQTPCTSFERLSPRQYFRNFRSLSNTITLTNYETAEGIFLGISRGKRPCHICASVNLDIYNECSIRGFCSKNEPCRRVIREISGKYCAVPNMVKYAE